MIVQARTRDIRKVIDDESVVAGLRDALLVNAQRNSPLATKATKANKDIATCILTVHWIFTVHDDRKMNVTVLVPAFRDFAKELGEVPVEKLTDEYKGMRLGSEDPERVVAFFFVRLVYFKVQLH